MPERPQGWILRMNQALSTRNYDGVFVQRFGESSEVFRIVHRMQDGEMTERVIATDGSGYEQKRKGSRWLEFMPEKRLVGKATRNRSFGYIPTLNGIDPIAARHYEIIDDGAARLLGQDVQLIRIEPKDALRYGYRFWIDHQSALPLKFQRVTHDGKVLKEFAFISPPGLPEQISDDQLKVAVDFSGYRMVDRDGFTPIHNPALKRNYLPQASLLPAGYRVRTFANRSAEPQDAAAEGPRARFIVSDGVSWGEVFVAPFDGKGKPASGFSAEPWTSYQLPLDGVMVTVVGEMPAAAAKAIAEAVRPE